MKKWIRENKLAILIAFSTFLIGILLFLQIQPFRKRVLVKMYENSNYTFQYDSSWKLNEEKDLVLLTHDSGSTISMEYLLLGDEYRYENLEEISSEILYTIGQENPGYHLLAQEFVNVSNNDYKGYQLLYEDENSEVFILFLKDNEKLLIFIYQAPTTYFDVLLDSVENVIDYFTFVEEPLDISLDIPIETNSIPWQENDQLVSDIKEKTEYQIANFHYLVKYLLPSNFQETKLDSSSGAYQYQGLSKDESVKVSTFIYNMDIYSYIEGNNLYGLFNSYRENSKSNFKEYLDHYADENYNRYIYKNNYDLEFLDTVHHFETIALIYEIHKNHIFVVLIETKNVSIPKELVDTIQILSVENYASYTDTVKKEDIQIFHLKQFMDNNYQKVETISLELSSKWREITSSNLISNNIYQKRTFGLDYLENLDYYRYSVEYDIFKAYSTDFEKTVLSYVKTQSNQLDYYSSYGKFEKLKKKDSLNLYNKEFSYYRGGYTNSSKVYVDFVLLYVPINSGVLEIKLLGNGVNISDNLIQEVAKFNIDIKEY